MMFFYVCDINNKYARSIHVFVEELKLLNYVVSLGEFTSLSVKICHSLMCSVHAHRMVNNSK